MRGLFLGLFVLPFLLGGPAAPLRAQAASPGGDPNGESYRYIPPPAWKSVEIGDFYLHRKDYRGAISRYNEAITTDPDYALAYRQLGKAYEKTGRRRRALAMYRKYLAELPSDKQAEEAKGVHRAIVRLERELEESVRTPQKKKK